MRKITRTVLIAGEGKLLTNGSTYCKEVYLGEGADASVWREVNENDVVEDENGY